MAIDLTGMSSEELAELIKSANEAKKQKSKGGDVLGAIKNLKVFLGEVEVTNETLEMAKQAILKCVKTTGFVTRRKLTTEEKIEAQAVAELKSE